MGVWLFIHTFIRITFISRNTIITVYVYILRQIQINQPCIYSNVLPVVWCTYLNSSVWVCHPGKEMHILFKLVSAYKCVYKGNLIRIYWNFHISEMFNCLISLVYGFASQTPSLCKHICHDIWTRFWYHEDPSSCHLTDLNRFVL